MRKGIGILPFVSPREIDLDQMKVPCVFVYHFLIKAFSIRVEFVEFGNMTTSLYPYKRVILVVDIH